MQITFFGAARTVTGSMHLVEVGDLRILLECGLVQGKRKRAFEQNRNLPFDPRKIDVCVLSHAHIDHSGNLPSLCRRGFRGPILSTPATRDLCAVMLQDSARLQERDVYVINKRRRRQGKRLFEPLYTVEDAERAMGLFQGVPYGETVDLSAALKRRSPRVRLTFHDAGHILGSAFAALDIRENGATRRLFFTGDMGRPDMPILRDPAVVPDMRFVITESTYGDRCHPRREHVEDELAELISKIAERRSKLIVPAFAVGRTQLLIFHLNELVHQGRIPPVPIFVDSPLSNRATQVFRDHPECYDVDTAAYLLRGDKPFSFDNLRYVRRVDESKELNRRSGPFIVIAGSGMCEGGRVVHHLVHGVGQADNIILLTGFQARHTLGRKLLRGDKRVNIIGGSYDVRAEVRVLNSLSAHADAGELKQYFRQADGEVERAFVVHGELDQSEGLQSELRALGWKDVIIPERGQTVTC